MKTNTQENEKGFVLVVVAALLVVLVGFVALGVDVGVLYSARTSAQAVADSAALAGASTFITNPTAVQPDTAINHAQQLALNNSILGQAVTAGNVSVVVDVPNRRVTVDVASLQNTYFARVLGSLNANVAVRAIAEAADQATEAIVKPWFIPNTILGTPTSDCNACTAGQVLISGNPPQVTTWAKTQLGTQFTLKPNNPSGAIAPGDFYGIQMPNDNNSGDKYRNNIALNLNPPARCDDSYDILKGNKVGPTKQGVDDLIGKPPRDTFQAVGQYVTPTGISDFSDALVAAPVWDTCASSYCPGNNFPNGQASLKVIGFALIFIDGIQGSDVKARIINISACGAGSATTQSGSAVLSLPLRLVRVP
jgi:hypothetical protein